MLAGSSNAFRMVFFGLTSVLALVLLGAILVRMPESDWMGRLSVAGILGGAIGNLIDKAMEAIERDNPTLKGMLPGNYGRATLDKRRLGDLVDLVSNKINFAQAAGAFGVSASAASNDASMAAIV